MEQQQSIPTEDIEQEEIERSISATGRQKPAVLLGVPTSGVRYSPQKFLIELVSSRSIDVMLRADH